MAVGSRRAWGRRAHYGCMDLHFGEEVTGMKETLVGGYERIWVDLSLYCCFACCFCQAAAAFISGSLPHVRIEEAAAMN